ncbi:MAG: DNA adenine methylase [Phycisphaerae bacterium]
MALAIVSNPLKWHGGKYYLAPAIVGLMPPHIHYVEPYAGGLSVLLAKNPDNVSEVVNDLNSDLTNFWDVLRSEKTFTKFQRIIQATPFSEAQWDRAAGQLNADDAVTRAAAFFVLCRQSHSGRMQSFATLTRNRTRRGMNEQASAWTGAVDGLPLIHARLRRVVILNRPAVDVITSQDGPNTLFYLDPPYVHETRQTTNEYGDFEMSLPQHQELIATVLASEGRFMISMYHHPLYDDLIERRGWRVAEFNLPNNAAGGQNKRRMVECVYMNF